MHLRYLWILNYKNLVQQGFQFDPTLSVHYDATDGALRIQEVEAKIPSGFFGQCLTNVTGILGDNGSGKSTLLEFIQFIAGSFKDDTTLLFESHNEAIIIFDNYILHHKSLKVNKRRSNTNGFTVLPYHKALNDNARRLSPPNDQYKSFYEYTIVSYSNTFETSVDNDNFNVIDITTSQLINESIWRQQAGRQPKHVSFLDYETSEFRSEINLLEYLSTQNLERIIPFPVPRYIAMKVLSKNEVHHLRDLNNDFLEANQANNLTSWLRTLETPFFPIYNRENELEPFEEFTRRLINIHLLVLLQLYPQALSPLSQEELNGLLTLSYSDVNLPEEALSSLDGLRVFVQYLQELQEAGRLQFRKHTNEYQQPEYYTVQLQAGSTDDRTVVRRFFELNRLSTLSNMKVTQLRWSGLSTGQTAYLRLHARFHNALEQIIEYNREHFYKIKNLLVLVDEGETNFHPQWQKQFIDVLLTILNTFFADFQVQLLICSNSPFIASDIPKSNLILLKRSENGLGEVQSWAGREQTFAANIHTLLTDSFFLQGGLMGDFAKRKLDEVLQYFVETANADAVAGSAQALQIIELIGEPIIKQKLYELWRTRFGLDEEATYLRQRLQQIEAAQQQRRHD